MKITKTQLREIIREELLNEGKEESRDIAKEFHSIQKACFDGKPSSAGVFLFQMRDTLTTLKKYDKESGTKLAPLYDSISKQILQFHRKSKKHVRGIVDTAGEL